MRSLRLAALVVGGVVVSALANSLAVQRVIADSVEPVTLEAESASAGSCGSSDFRISDRSASESPCQRHAQESTETARGRAYLVATASPGYTMIRQGSERAIGRLHPEFVNRLAAAVAEARGSGLPFAGIFSAYRPPAFGVGGFIDKFHSLHTYGLAVDITGIGAPGTPSALLWHEIAARHGVICPYGPHNPVEWNHCQPTQVKIIQPENPLRETVTAEGPTSLEDMFEVGYSLIAVPGSVSETAPDPPPHLFKRRQGIAIPVERRINTSIIAPPKSSASWAVLLVGDRSESNALAAYNLISKKHPTILGAYQPVIVHTSLGLNTRTNWHRVRIEANSRAAVEALCSKLRAAGERCLVQRT